MIKSIIFVITSMEAGTGGHFYSLSTTAKILQSKFNVYIVQLGKTLSPVIKHSGINYSHLYTNFINQKEVTTELTDICKQVKPDIIHAFDWRSYILCFDAARRLNLHLALTKCGGPVRRDYPEVNNLVVFTKEDLDFYQTKVNLSKTQLVFIPNRVQPFVCDQQRMSLLNSVLNLNGRRVILRIGRISSAYYETIVQSINMARDLHKYDQTFSLVLIGNIESELLFKQIMNDIADCDFIHVVSDKTFTLNAKTLINIAEIVVGTGRGFMEACCMNKIMMAPNKGQRYPVLVTHDNFNDIFYYNFSERYGSQDNLTAIELLKRINEYQDDSSLWFDQYFSTSPLESLYSSFYDNLKPTLYNNLLWSVRWKLIRLKLKTS